VAVRAHPDILAVAVAVARTMLDKLAMVEALYMALVVGALRPLPQKVRLVVVVQGALVKALLALEALVAILPQVAVVVVAAQTEVRPQLQLAVRGGHMAVAVAVVAVALVVAQEVLAWFALFTPVQHAHTHQQIQVICNGTLYSNS
jgi:hypothetical protein